MTDENRIILVLGGARSGKSAYAESLSQSWPGAHFYIATAQALDDEEMGERIREHQARRGDKWETVPAVLDLPGAIRKSANKKAFVLVDCLTLWLTNILLAEEDWEVALRELLEALDDAEGMLVLVSNEVGGGIVPGNKLARRFRDAAGDVNRRVAEVADEVVLITAGLPQVLKSATG